MSEEQKIEKIVRILMQNETALSDGFCWYAVVGNVEKTLREIAVDILKSIKDKEHEQ